MDWVSFIQEHYYILYFGILVLSFATIFRAKLIILGELIILAAFLGLGAGESTTLLIILAAIQVVFAAILVMRIKKAVDTDYILVLEKTHLIPMNITKGGGNGGI